MKIHLIIFILLLSFLGCGSTKPVPVIEEKKVLNSYTKKSNIEKTVNKKPNFNKKNITQVDETTHIFKNCFTTGNIHIHKSCQAEIDMFLKSIPLQKKRKILIEVHTDKGGSKKKNLNISIRRAKNIAGSLYYKEYKNSKIYYKGFGKSQLIYDDETKKANIENRRVVVKLRSKNFKFLTQEYKLFLKEKKLKRKAKKHLSKKLQKQKKLNILSYTGEADTGWIYFGKPSLAKKFTISCAEDKPLKVKHKAINKSKKSEFMSTFYDKKISTSFSDKELEVYPIYIYENGKQPINNPTLFLKKENTTLRFQTTVNTYRGKKGILYRIFVNGKKEVSCVDLVIPYDDDRVSYGRVYMKNKREFTLKP